MCSSFPTGLQHYRDMEDVEADYDIDASHLGCPGFCVLVRALDVVAVSSVTLGSAASRWRRYEDTCIATYVCFVPAHKNTELRQQNNASRIVT